MDDAQCQGEGYRLREKKAGLLGLRDKASGWRPKGDASRDTDVGEQGTSQVSVFRTSEFGLDTVAKSGAIRAIRAGVGSGSDGGDQIF